MISRSCAEVSEQLVKVPSTSAATDDLPRLNAASARFIRESTDKDDISTDVHESTVHETNASKSKTSARDAARASSREFLMSLTSLSFWSLRHAQSIICSGTFSTLLSDSRNFISSDDSVILSISLEIFAVITSTCCSIEIVLVCDPQ